MKTLATPITNSLDVPRITRFEVVDVVDADESTPPFLMIQVRLRGAGATVYSDPILYAYDSQASQCLRLNPAQQGYSDLCIPYGKVVTNAYTTLSAAYNGNIANPNKRKRCLAVEALLAGTLLDAEFATT